jgi:hypothetical protein
MRVQAEEKIGDPSKTEDLRQLLQTMWNELQQSGREKYEMMEAEDKTRYNREMAAFKK